MYLDAFRWLNGARLRLPDTPAGALVSHLGAEDEDESRAPHLDDSARAADAGEDPGVLDPAAPDEAQLAAYEAALDAGALPEFTRVRLL